MAVGTDDVAIGGVSVPVLTVGVVTFGHVAALLAVPSVQTVVTIVTLEAILLAIVGGIGVLGERDPVALGVTMGSYASAVAVGWLVVTTQRLAVAAVTVVGVLLVIGYTVHRYELVVLGLVETTDE